MWLLLRAPISIMLYKLATPNIAATLMMTAITFADAWFVGQLGTAALAGLALVFPFLILMQMMAAGAIGIVARARAYVTAGIDRGFSLAGSGHDRHAGGIAILAGQRGVRSRCHRLSRCRRRPESLHA